MNDNRSRRMVLMAIDQNNSDHVVQAQVPNPEDVSNSIDYLPIQFEDGFILENDYNLVELHDENLVSNIHTVEDNIASTSLLEFEKSSATVSENYSSITDGITEGGKLNTRNEIDVGLPVYEYEVGIVATEQIEEIAESQVPPGVVEEECCREETNSEGENLKTGVKRKRNKRVNVNKSHWKRNYNKIRRMQGESYLGFTRDNQKVWKNDTEREARTLGPRCSGKHAKIYECSKISDERRNMIFSKFWSQLSWDQKKMYVINHVQKSVPKRRRSENEDTQKTTTFMYYLKNDESSLRVCKQMFLNTLAIKEWSVRSWCLKSVSGTLPSEELKKQEHAINRQARGCVLKHKAKRQFLESWLDNLPKLPSHYTRQDTKKLYIEDPFMKSKSQLYRLYVEDCKDTKPLSSFIFAEIFDKKNIAIFQPKKDQCDLCYAYKSGNFSTITESEYEVHIKNKDRARTEKQTDKEHALLGECNMITMDMQAVQLCPRLHASKLYFKLKLRVHNFTIFNVATRQSTNFWWHEGEGEVTSPNFASCIINYLYTHFKDSDKPIILYSDGCGYQNRCAVLSNALLTFAAQHNKTIEQKYLCKGHTQMECDSVHSLIERQLDRRDINLPGEFVSVTKHARSKPFPLDAKYLTHDFFLNYALPEFQWYKSIRPGNAYVIDIKCLKYTPAGEIFFRTDFDSEYKPLRRNKALPKTPICYPKLYASKPKISLEKYNHLLEIAAVMDPEYTNFYKNLPHENRSKKSSNATDLF